jgi:hypothetical protein
MSQKFFKKLFSLTELKKDNMNKKKVLIILMREANIKEFPGS